MNRIKPSLRRFYQTAYYPLLVVGLAFLGHVTGQEFLFIGLIICSLIPALLFAKDARFAVMPILSILFTISKKDYVPGDTGYSERFLNTGVLIFAGVLACLLIPSLIYFFVSNRKTVNKPATHGIWQGCAIFCAAMFFNGLFSKNYEIRNVIYVLLVSACLLAVYFLFALYMNFDRTSIDYLMYCFVLAGLLISCELIAAYFTTATLGDKGSVVLGWGIWTAIGGMLVFLMPACFYFAASHQHGWIGFGLGLFEFFCIFLSQSRGALLFGAMGLGLCFLYLFFRGRNRKQNRIFILLLAGMGLVGAILLKDKIFEVLKNLTDLGDNGRKAIWEIGWNNFTKYPIFGSGFYDSFVDPAFEHGFDPYLYHNTVIQMLGACGLVGFLAYAYHRIQTVRLVFTKMNPCKIFLGIALLAFLSFNLLDVLFFKFYPSFFYALMLLCMEKSELCLE